MNINSTVPTKVLNSSIGQPPQNNNRSYTPAEQKQAPTLSLEQLRIDWSTLATKYKFFPLPNTSLQTQKFDNPGTIVINGNFSNGMPIQLASGTLAETNFRVINTGIFTCKARKSNS